MFPLKNLAHKGLRGIEEKIYIQWKLKKNVDIKTPLYVLYVGSSARLWYLQCICTEDITVLWMDK